MTNDEFKTLKDVSVRDITLHSGDQQVTLFYIMDTLQIFEDMWDSVMTGQVTLSDSRNVLSLFSIVGGEKLTLSFKSRGYPDYVNLEFYIYKVSDRFITKDRHSIYTLHFCSKELIVDQLRHISRAVEGSPDEVIKDLVSNPLYGLNSLKPVDIEPTLYPNKWVIPYWTPLKTIQWLTKRSVSGVYPTSTYCFFENKKGFKLSSIENMFNKPVVKQFIYGPKLDQSSNRDMQEDFNKVESYHIKSTFDLLKSIRDGAYASKLYTYDMVNKRFQTVIYNYDEAFEASTHLNDHQTVQKEKKFDEIVLTQSFDSNIKYATKHGELHDLYFDDSFVETWAQNRGSQMSQLESLCLELTVPGDSAINVGDIIEFKVPSVAASSDNSKQLDDILSGRYLVTAISHRITQETYSMIMEVSKDSFFKALSGRSLNG